MPTYYDCIALDPVDMAIASFGVVLTSVFNPVHDLLSYKFCEVVGIVFYDSRKKSGCEYYTK